MEITEKSVIIINSGKQNYGKATDNRNSGTGTEIY